MDSPSVPPCDGESRSDLAARWAREHLGRLEDQLDLPPHERSTNSWRRETKRDMRLILAAGTDHPDLRAFVDFTLDMLACVMLDHMKGNRRRRSDKPRPAPDDRTPPPADPTQ